MAFVRTPDPANRFNRRVTNPTRLSRLAVLSMKTPRFPTIIAGSLGLTLVATAAQFKFATQTLTVPDGFEIELVATAPLVDRPIEADFDELGRLYVSDSSGTNEKPDKQLISKPHRIVRLEDTDGDGKFDKQVVFADKMMFPEGVMWHDGSLYVSAPPSIWKLSDTNGDGIADLREEWFQGQTLTGCANDLHGPYFGPDGLIYWCKGAFAEQNHPRPGKSPIITRAAHIFRARPDGSALETVMTGGMDNPVGVAFSATGERFFTSTFIHRPEVGKRDGVTHAIYGGVYGKPNDATDGHKRTGDLMPVMSQFGAAAPVGLVRYEAGAFGRDYDGNLFVCQFNLNKVSRHQLDASGATYQSTERDFVTSDSSDFHPTDIFEDADGTLVLIDTGGWYKLCCPTSQLAKPDVLGGIYRIRPKGLKGLATKPDPRGLAIPWPTLGVTELAGLLYDHRLAVRQRAIQQFAKQGDQAVPALVQVLRRMTAPVGSAPSMVGADLGLDQLSPTARARDARRDAVWALTRIDSGAARDAVRLALGDPDETVAHTAISSVSLWRDGVAGAQLAGLLEKGTPALGRAAAEALGRIGNKAAVPALLAASGTYVDRILEHSLTYALIEIGDAEGTAVGLHAASSHTRRVALIALDQMEGGRLKPATVTPLLVSSDPVLKETAWWLANRHADWAPALAASFRSRLLVKQPTDADLAELVRQMQPFTRNTVIQDMLAAVAVDLKVSLKSRVAALQVMAGTQVKELPPSWLPVVMGTLHAPEEVLVGRAVLVARAIPAPKAVANDFNTALLRVANDTRLSDQTRLDALAAVAGGLEKVTPPIFDFLRANVDPAKPVLTRGTAASVLAKADLTDEQLDTLTATVKSAGPLEMPKLLGAYEKASNEDLGLKLVGALEGAKGFSALRADILKPRLTNFPASVQARGDELLAKLNTDAPKQKAHLDDLFAQLKGGDVRRGQAIFNSAKTACITCHSVGYSGGQVGPDLTNIGQVRTERDLLEAIVYPSASFVRSYEPMRVATKSGEEYNGVVRRDTPDELVLATGPGAETHIARSDVTEMRPGTVSVMPQGLDEQLNKQELADLLAFLKFTRWGAQ